MGKFMLEDLIKKCIDLEKGLNNYKLWADMVPKSCFYKNLRSCFSKKDWDLIRKRVYKKDGHKCSICGVENDRLEAHEEWKYYYKDSVQKLQSINSLCFWCHRNKHLGHAFILVDQGKLDPEKIISHWAKINHKTRNDFRDYSIKAMELWELKNTFNWKIIDNKGNKLKEGININTVLKLIKPKIGDIN